MADADRGAGTDTGNRQRGRILMAPAKDRQSGFRCLPFSLGTWPVIGAGTSMEVRHMNWLWLNVPLMALFFVVTAGIPLWLVIRHPDTGPAAVRQPGQGFTHDEVQVRDLAGVGR